MTATTSSFQLYDNSFDGAVPTQIGLMTAMASIFYLQFNKFSALPTQLGRMTAMGGYFYLNE